MSAQNRVTVERNIKQDTGTKKYYVTFYYGKDEAGNNKRKTKAFDSLNEARIALQTHELAILKGDSPEPSRMDLNTAVQRHLDALSLKSEESTLYGYQTIAKHIARHKIGKRPVQELKPVDVQAYLQYLQKELRLSSNTSLKHYHFLNAVFNLLEKQEMIARNPIKRVITPKKNKHDAEYLTVEEARAILERAQGDRIALPLALGLFTGMRRGELCGLKWDCVDFEKGTLSVKLNRLNVGADIVLKRPKSDAGERVINMVPELKAILLEEMEIQGRNADLLRSEYHGEGYVICFNNGKEVRPNYLSEMFKQWFGKINNRDLHTVTPHGLRHSFVALAIAAGVPLYEISQALGHGDINITSRIYAHLLDNTHVNATESMAGLLRGE